ncbi:hypothetical protein [Alicyclobacillus suci]|uniref:hypothetical protein n=1 Tax=Alicyclobacillus suci TaxID=2816080 RepID=UPI001A8F2F06|nr:hypothetical protein [Alicyclobacillus suci]
MRPELEQTIESLCQWIRDRAEQGYSGEELRVLPEIIASTAQLISVALKVEH